jgi:hypothetical protein
MAVEVGQIFISQAFARQERYVGLSARAQCGYLQDANAVARSLVEQRSRATILDQAQRLGVHAEEACRVDHQVDVRREDKMCWVDRQYPKIQRPPFNPRPAGRPKVTAGGDDRVAIAMQRSQQVASDKTAASHQ